ncbi:MAG TPA: BLUF domain-containing protein [Rhizomicrobium sp.]|nr:BLUF domain-containing protein [Rhizomicrobium sp.]
MRQLVYVSAASRTLSPADLDSILASARRANPQHDVTGMLLYIDLGFLQVLEGPADGVETTYRRILNDDRHTAQRILVDRTGRDRLFGGWSMGFDRPSPDQAQSAGAFKITRDALNDAVPKDKASEIATLLRTFYNVNAQGRAA